MSFFKKKCGKVSARTGRVCKLDEHGTNIFHKAFDRKGKLVEIWSEIECR